jgi:hypothetical protein
VAYWWRFGDAVAGPAEAVKPPPSAGPLEARAVRVRPEVAAAVLPLDLNVVYQRLELPPAERFDLVVATNILLYYDTFEQCLALGNVARMMAVGGLFLTNNVVLELPGSALRSVGYRRSCSRASDDGEHVIFYRQLPTVAPLTGRPSHAPDIMIIYPHEAIQILIDGLCCDGSTPTPR